MITNIAGITLDELESLISRLDEKAFRAKQIYCGLYKHRFTNLNQFSNLSKLFINKLSATAKLCWPSYRVSYKSIDGSIKYLFSFEDKNNVEAVYIPYENRATICLSSQVGCSMGCCFCATSHLGFIRNLSSAEIIGQLVTILNDNNCDRAMHLNLVFMGMGEPLNNLKEVMRAFDVFHDANGFNIPARRITISTSGIVPGIEQLSTYTKRPALALSLNATTDKSRSQIMPVNKAWNLHDLTTALKNFPLRNRESFTIEYVIIKDVNDSIDDARRLALFANQFPSKVNIIPFNKSKYSNFESGSEVRIGEFCAILRDNNIVVSIRRSRGRDIYGACGQMAFNN